jgi:cytoskeletal protein RodZ
MENLDQPSIEANATITVLRIQLGQILMQERVSQKKDAVDVARRLMLSKQQLLAIEAGESASFHHERRYIQGIKSYVFYLGLQSRLEV